MELSASVCSSAYHHLSATEGHAGCDSRTQETTTTTTTTQQQQQQQLELARRTKRQQRACAGLRRRCYAVLKQQRTRLYILRRCVTMLLCWHEHDLSD